MTETINDQITLTDEVDAELIEGDGEYTEDDTDLLVDDEDDEDDDAIEGDVEDADGNVVAKAPKVTKAELTAKAKADAEKPLCTPKQAEALTKKLVDSLGKATDIYVEVWEKRAWKALKYASFQEYLEDKLGDLRLRLDRPKRLELLGGELRKMSSRDAAAMLGVNQTTVTDDRKYMKESGEDVTDEVVGADGKSYSSEGEGTRGRKVNWANRADKAAERTQDAVNALSEAANTLFAAEDDEEYITFRETWMGELGQVRAMLDAVLNQMQ